VSIENCIFSGFPPEGDLWLHAGIWVNTNAVVSVANSTFRDNAIGVFLGAGSSTSISNSQFVNNGIWVTNYTAGTTTRAAVSDTVVTGASRGVYAWSTVAGANVRVSVTRVVATGNDTAFILNGFAGSTLTVSGSTATGNIWGFYNASADSIFRSTLDNIVADNPSGDTTGVITTLVHK
jgi:hypothetical protein